MASRTFVRSTSSGCTGGALGTRLPILISCALDGREEKEVFEPCGGVWWCVCGWGAGVCVWWGGEGRGGGGEGGEEGGERAGRRGCGVLILVKFVSSSF